MIFPALVFLGLKNNDCCGCCGNESCGKRFAVSERKCSKNVRAILWSTKYMFLLFIIMEGQTDTAQTVRHKAGIDSRLSELCCTSDVLRIHTGTASYSNNSTAAITSKVNYGEFCISFGIAWQFSLPFFAGSFKNYFGSCALCSQLVADPCKGLWISDWVHRKLQVGKDLGKSLDPTFCLEQSALNRALVWTYSFL